MDLGGAVTVESERGKGTQIVVEIPSVSVERK